jgi:hypothetical protein
MSPGDTGDETAPCFSDPVTVVYATVMRYGKVITTDRRSMADLFTTQLAKHEGSLPPASRRVAQFIDANRAAVLASSAAELGQRTGTSDATVIRTVQALGFPGLGPLKQALVSSVERLPALVDDMGRTLGEVGDDTASAVDQVFSAHADAIDKLRQQTVRDRIVEAVTVLHPAARIAVFGIGPSAALASYVAMLLARTGRRTLISTFGTATRCSFWPMAEPMPRSPRSSPRQGVSPCRSCWLPTAWRASWPATPTSSCRRCADGPVASRHTARRWSAWRRSCSAWLPSRPRRCRRCAASGACAPPRLGMQRRDWKPPMPAKEPLHEHRDAKRYQ